MRNFKKTLVLVLLVLPGSLYLACKKNDNTIIIKGNIKGLNTDKVYLYRCFDRPLKPFDSAEVINNTFKFEYHPDTAFEPVVVFIGYTDHKTHKHNGLAIINPYTSPNNKPGLFVSLYMEPGVVQLTGNLNKNPGIHLEGGPQNEFYFRNVSLAFTRFEKDSIRREAHIDAFRELIKNNTDAHWGIFSLMNVRGGLKKSEIQSIYNEFDDNVKNAYTGRLVKQYIENMTTVDGLRPNDMLSDTNNRLVNIIDTTRKLNMLVFWASWCGPCNAEIPSLKKIAAEFKSNDFRMVSISIDVNADQWNTVRRMRAMPWQQLIVPKDIRDKVLAQYNLQFIPQIYFVDNKRKLIKHIEGNSDENEDICRKTIIAALNKN